MHIDERLAKAERDAQKVARLEELLDVATGVLIQSLTRERGWEEKRSEFFYEMERFGSEKK